MTEIPSVVLDACVLANFSLCDTLLRLAEPPRLFIPRWSEEIIEETVRTLHTKLGWPPSLTAYFQNQLQANFSGAWIRGHELWIGRMTNNSKDRHVAAAALHGNVPWIVTFNLRDFKPEDLSRWDITALHPQAFLTKMLSLQPEIMLTKLRQQASERGRTLRQLLRILQVPVPEFSRAVLSLISSE